MSWFPDYTHRETSALSDSALLVVGKALYLCNSFESKCTYVLSIASVATLIEEKPETSIFDAFDMFKEKLLGPTIQGLRIHIEDKDIATLDEARVARNYIAHQGATSLISISGWPTFAKLNRLREKVRTLTHGLNLVSLWCYEIENKETGPRGFYKEYPELVDKWVFSELNELMNQFSSHPEVMKAETELSKHED